MKCQINILEFYLKPIFGSNRDQMAAYKLKAQIFDAKYSQIQTELKDGWKTYLPNAELSWNFLDLSAKPFQIEIHHGLVSNLTASKNISNWEANIIKSIISQFQINTETASNQELHENQKNSAVFITNEDTITGNFETLYKINPLPEHFL